MPDEILELDQKIKKHIDGVFRMTPSKQYEQDPKFREFFDIPTIEEGSTPTAPKKQKVRLRKQSKEKRKQRRLNREQSLHERVATKLIDSAVYGYGIPGEGVVPKSVHGLDLGVNDQGQPAAGIDRNRFLSSLDDEEKKYMANLLGKQKAAFIK